MNAVLLASSEGSGTFVDLDVHPWQWGALLLFITALLLFDVLVVHRRPHEIRFKAAAVESAVWICIGLAFTGVVHHLGRTSGVAPDGAHGVDVGARAAGEYISGFLIEKSLSIDNVFVWAVIFTHFAVPPKYQFRTLFWGVFGALVLRAAFIFAGLALLEAVAFTLVVFGVVLIYTAQKVAFHDDQQVDPDSSIVLRLVRRVIPSTSEYDGQRLITRRDGRWLATPLLAVLIVIETTDVVFAVDSVPAVLAVSTESFIVFSSNAFAILGLRALYFVVHGMQDRFRHLHRGLGVILAFVGVKMILTFTAEAFAFPTEELHIATPISLGVIVVVLTVTIVTSLVVDRKDGGSPEGPAAVVGDVRSGPPPQTVREAVGPGPEGPGPDD